MGGRRQNRPTLKTISELCGLAVPTVSRALNDAADISQETKALVRRVADEVGYVPDRAGLRLKTGRTQMAAFVIGAEQALQDHTGPVIASIISELERSNYNLVVLPQGPSEEPVASIRKIVNARLADVIILNRIKPEDERVRFLLDEEFAFITHGRTIWHSQHAYVDYDNGRFARLAVRTLATSGRRHLALLQPPAEHNFSQDMLNGALLETKNIGLTLRVVDGVTSDDRPDAIVAGMRGFLNRHPETDGVICASGSKSSAVVSAFESVGRVLGQDVDVCAKDVVPTLSLAHPGVLAIIEDLNEAGRALARGALQAASGPDAGRMQKLVQLPLPELDPIVEAAAHHKK